MNTSSISYNASNMQNNSPTASERFIFKQRKIKLIIINKGS